jgi:hypothetical protein
MSKYYDIITIEQYLAGKLNAKDMYRLERDALTDPMLQDAIDGFEASNTIPHQKISLLQQRLHTRIAQQNEKRNHFYFGRQRLAIASIAGVLFIVVCILFWMINFPLKKATQQSATSEVSISLQPVVSTTLKSGNLEPEIGWEDYNHYLRINNQGNISSERIEVSFNVINHRPSSIKIISSENEKASQEVLRLIESGPKWKGASGVLVIEF